jgi:hypothetical protein
MARRPPALLSALIHPSAGKVSHSPKFAVAISGPPPVETANTVEVLSHTGDTPPNVATNEARKRGKRLRLATV